MITLPPDLDTTKLSKPQLHQFISKLDGVELSNVSKSCYYPKISRYMKDLQIQTGIKKENIEDFWMQFYFIQKKKNVNFAVIKDPMTLLNLMCIMHATQNRKKDTSFNFHILMALKFYSHRLHLHLRRFCKDGVWEATLNQLSSKHLFRAKGGIGPALLHLAQEMKTKYDPYFSRDEVDEMIIIKYVYELRHRVAQSVKSFAQLYYKLYSSGASISSDSKNEEDAGGASIDKISSMICTYGQIDRESLQKAVSFSGIKTDVANSIIEDISTVVHKDGVNFILVLLSKLTPAGFRELCRETKRNSVVRQVLNNSRVGKYSIKEEILKLLYATEHGYVLKSLNKNQLVSFFANYITLYTKNLVC